MVSGKGRGGELAENYGLAFSMTRGGFRIFAGQTVSAYESTIPNLCLLRY